MTAVVDTRPSVSWDTVRRAQQGDMDAFAAVWTAYQPQILGFVTHRTGHRQLAEDITSEVFVRALRGLHRVEWQGRDIAAWLITIARNMVADYFKSGRYRLERQIGLPEDSPQAIVLDTAPGPAELAEAADVAARRSAAVLWAMSLLTPEQRQVIHLRFYRHLSVAEAAAAMGIEVGAAKALQYRAVRAMARHLPEELPS